MTKTPEAREEKIIYILLNYIALEGAIFHFEDKFEDDFDCSSLLKEIDEIGIPATWDLAQQLYGYDNKRLRDGTDAQKCWEALSRIRNNFVHANKAKIVDGAEKLEKLMDWSIQFIRHIEENEQMPKRLSVKETFHIKSW